MGGFLVRTEEMRVRFPLGPPDYVGRGRVAQASDCDSLHESSILSGQPSLGRGARTFACRECGGAGAFACQQFCGRRSKERTERYERSNGGSIPSACTIRPSSNGKGRSAPNAEMPVRIRRAGPKFRGGGRAAKAPDCLSGPGRFDSVPPRHGAVGKWLKPPASQAGDREFESHRPCQVFAASSFWRDSFCGVEHDRTSALTFNQVTVGSIPTYPATGPIVGPTRFFLG